MIPLNFNYADTVCEIEHLIGQTVSDYFCNLHKNDIDKFFTSIPFTILASELLPLIEVGASWEVCAFVSHIYLPSSSGSPYPDIFF